MDLLSKSIEKALNDIILVIVGNTTYDRIILRETAEAAGAIYSDKDIRIPLSSITLKVDKAFGGGPCGNGATVPLQSKNIAAKNVKLISRVCSAAADTQKKELAKYGFGSSNLYLEEVPSPLTLSFILPNPEIKTRAILTFSIDTREFLKNNSIGNKTVSGISVRVTPQDLERAGLKIENGMLVISANKKHNIAAHLEPSYTQNVEPNKTNVAVHFGDSPALNFALTEELHFDHNSLNNKPLSNILPARANALLFDGKNDDMALETYYFYYEKYLKGEMAEMPTVVVDAGRVAKNEKGETVVDPTTHKLSSLNNSHVVCCEEYAEAVAQELKFKFDENRNIDWDIAQKIYSCMVKKYPNAKEIIITLGSRGTLFMQDNNLVFLPALRIPNVKDSNGAGDMFHGAYLNAISLGYNTGDAVILATIVGGLSVEYDGGRPREELLADAIKIMNGTYEKEEYKNLYNNMINSVDWREYIKSRQLILTQN